MDIVRALFDAILNGAVIFFGVMSVILVSCFIAFLTASLLLLGIILVW